MRKILRKIISLFCICNECPSYPAGGDPLVYCEFKKSEKEVKKKGCACDGCFVWKVNKFKNYYYCIEGKDPESKI